MQEANRTFVQALESGVERNALVIWLSVAMANALGHLAASLFLPVEPIDSKHFGTESALFDLLVVAVVLLVATSRSTVRARRWCAILIVLSIGLAVRHAFIGLGHTEVRMLHLGVSIINIGAGVVGLLVTLGALRRHPNPRDP